jgi:DNA-directed RNA polymerase specialized sigma24 family protein
LDGLYRGALFLNAGEEPPAEDLVLATMTGAFQEFRRIEEGSASEQWLEGKLVGAFLAHAASGSTEDVSMAGFPVDVASRQEPYTGALEIDPEELFRTGATMPPLARAAIWLVVFRRWPYREASRVLKTDSDGLKGLLRYRQMLLAAVVRGSVDRNGTDHDGRL